MTWQTHWWNSIDIPRIDPCKYDQLIFDKGTETTEKKKFSFSKNCVEAIVHSYAEAAKKNQSPYASFTYQYGS